MKRIVSVFVLGFATLLGAAHLAEAHTLTGWTQWWCSPHNEEGSVSSSYFSDCQYNSSKSRFERIFECADKTGCANALCPGGIQACGKSYSSGSTAHGKNGGHAFGLVEGTYVYCGPDHEEDCLTQ